MSRGIEIDLRDMLNEEELPNAILPENNILKIREKYESKVNFEDLKKIQKKGASKNRDTLCSFSRIGWSNLPIAIQIVRGVF
jgi:hypothetical protein